MSERTVTEREAVLRERKAYENGMIRGSACEFTCTGSIRVAALEAYPLPKVERPRVVNDDGKATGLMQTWWRVVDGELQWAAGRSPANLDWVRLKEARNAGMFITEWRAVLLADLLANPTEWVEADDQ